VKVACRRVRLSKIISGRCSIPPRVALAHRLMLARPLRILAAPAHLVDGLAEMPGRLQLDVLVLEAAVVDADRETLWNAAEAAERYEDYFKHAARGLLGCLLADIVFDPAIPPARKTLGLLRERVSRPIPELKELLEAIYAKGSSYGFGFPAQLAGNLKDIAEKQFSGFYGEAGNATSWLAIPSLARLVCGQGFRTRNLLSGRLDVFINLPLKVLQTSPQAARVILGALLNSVYEARGRAAGRMLFLLDEVARLGYMGILETARDTGRKYDINLCLLYQSLGQLTQSWGRQGRQAWFDSAYLKALLPYPGLRGGRFPLARLRRIHRARRLGDRRLRLVFELGAQFPLDPLLDQPAAGRQAADQARRNHAGTALRRTDRARPERPAAALRAGDLFPPAGYDGPS